jgi:ribonuclease R
MELSISALLTNFTQDKLIAPKAIEKKLGCEDAISLHRLQIALDALEKMGILVKERGKYRRVIGEGVIEGKLRCSSKGFCFAIQDEEGTEDVYIRESQLSNAWNGDRVLVKVTKEGRRRRSPEGEVQLILERGNPSVIARVEQTEQGFRGVPLDDRLLFELELRPSDRVPDLDAAVDQLVHAEICRYPLGQYLPIAQVTQVLGNDTQSAADRELVCCKYDLNRGFSEAAIKAAQAHTSKLKKTDFKNRLDFRKVQTITINTDSTAEHFADGALSLEPMAAGISRLGIHVADVSHYITPDTSLDREASKRGTAICMDEMGLALVPEDLSLARLAPGQERLALSLLFLFNKSGEVLEYEIQPTVIQVDHALSYQQAQAILQQQTGSADLADLKPIFPLVERLGALSQIIRQHRQQRGSFDLSLAANRFYGYDDEGLLGAMARHSVDDLAYTLVTEIMVLSNQTVISHLQALGLPAVYRVQSPPDVYDVQELIKLAANLGIQLSLSQEESVQPQDFQNFAAQLRGSELAPLLMELLLKTLKPAVDSAKPGPHFSLASVQGYGHFCSPLRRYADLINHRVLWAIFEHGRDRKTSRAKEQVNLRHSTCLDQVSWNILPPEIQRDLEAMIAIAMPNLLERERIAQQAIKDLQGLQKVKQMQQRTGEVLRGLITGIQSYGFFVEIEDLMVEGLVHVSSLKDDWYEYRSRQQTLIGRKNRQQYRLGDRVEVQVKSVDYYRQQIDLVVVGGGSEAPADDELEEPDGEEFESQRD